MPTVVKTSAHCAMLELTLRFSHTLRVDLMLRHFLSDNFGFLLCLKTHWTTQTLVPSILSVFSTTLSSPLSEINVGMCPLYCNISGEIRDFLKEVIYSAKFSHRGPPQPGNLGFDHPGWVSAWKMLCVFPQNLGFIFTKGGKSEIGGRDTHESS